ncbi:Uncharacterised protein (plasmid) [Tsukamurella tyrosinosolvens]|uniref:Transposase n=3 Tax=Tsukamurella TaxID=2060 RepID=A0A5C5RPU0_9ACTN|nr:MULTISPECIES: DUF6262 family protein [Tsukamurella]KXO90363.1 hypothetical protein AXK56_09695 [Tsukamurella pulmonis]KXO95112.1 hypothetical protein AXK58_10235 [Tsukamurella tyrosinosolvens]TWS24161.1 hypothetical protein FK268_11135 [Tsukamurella sputi]SDQ50513.1 hypothetical protein SAMN04489765_0669 [Tsukamurella pulmonis]SED54299.1 hypothetical protein SAMN04489793_5157 [Tsukamurella tyrosinosolvens]
MTANDASLAALAESAEIRSEASRRRIDKALKAMRRNGEAINVQAVARRAGLARTTVYRHKDLLGQIHRQRRTATAVPSDHAASGQGTAASDAGVDPSRGVAAALHLRIRQKDATIAELTGQVKALEATIARLHGVIDDLSPD